MTENPTATTIAGYHVNLDTEPAYTEYNARIINTLQNMAKNGRKKATIKGATSALRQMNRLVDLMEPETVKLHIANMTMINKDGKEQPVDDTTKHIRTAMYNNFVKTNNLHWNKPVFKINSKIPITPTKEQAETIIACAPTINTATQFRILLEAGFEGEELHCTMENDIDTEQGIITVAGHKQHNGRSYKLKSSTAEMLKIYMATHHREHPFSTPKNLYHAWVHARDRASTKLSRTDLKKIPLKGLRNLSGILLFQKCKDPWTVMLHMGHKKLDTTQHYLRAMTTMQNQDPEYNVTVIAKGQPDTMKKIMDVAEQGFTKFDEDDEYKYYRIPK
jgi:integrase